MGTDRTAAKTNCYTPVQHIKLKKAMHSSSINWSPKLAESPKYMKMLTPITKLQPTGLKEYQKKQVKVKKNFKSSFKKGKTLQTSVDTNKQHSEFF